MNRLADRALSRGRGVGVLRVAVAGLAMGWGAGALRAHIVPPEQFHPVAESYRRMNFVLNLNPVDWELVGRDAGVIMAGFAEIDAEESKEYQASIDALIGMATAEGDERISRRESARKIFELCTETVGEMIVGHLEAAREALGDYGEARAQVNLARQLWASFEHEVKATDREGFRLVGGAWLGLTSAMGTPGIEGVGVVAADEAVFGAEAEKIMEYVSANFSEGFRAGDRGPLAALPRASEGFDPMATVPIKLPPGSEMNKQLPRPRQVLNMAERGVDEGDTTMIALGDMAFDSAYIFGEPARSLGISCNTCHNKSITNPQFFIPGLSAERGGMDVSGSFFGPHANNGHYDPLDIPDLRGIRFTAPYGRNGRFASLREFTRNVIVSEFSGPEPDPALLDGMIAYMNEFDFLPNEKLTADGRLSDGASAAERRGETLFNKPFEQMRGQSCATCHMPTANFLDHQQHNIGSVAGTAAFSQDGALDTPTLLSSKFTQPYFHDGSLPTLRAVNEWFNEKYELGLGPDDLDDLTAYVEAVGDGVDAYEDTMYTLDAELEEFSFFLSAYEYLRRVGKTDLIATTFETVGAEIQAHKWDLREQTHMGVLNEMAGLMDEAYTATRQSDMNRVDEIVAEYRGLYAANAEVLR